MRNILWINGRDVGADFGLMVRRVEAIGAKWNSAAGQEALLGRAGVLRDVGHIPMGSKTLIVRARFKADSVSQLRANVAEFFRWVRFGELHEIETFLHPGKVVFARLLEPDIEWDDPGGVQRITEEGTLSFLMHAPMLYDKYPSSYAGNVGDRVSPALGNWPSSPTISLFNPSGVSNPNISLYRANGTLIKTVTFTTTVASTDYIVHNSDEMSTQTVTAGVFADAPTIAPAGDPFFILNPADGDPINGLYPYFMSTNAAIIVDVRRLYSV